MRYVVFETTQADVLYSWLIKIKIKITRILDDCVKNLIR